MSKVHLILLHCLRCIQLLKLIYNSGIQLTACRLDFASRAMSFAYGVTSDQRTNLAIWQQKCGGQEA